MCSGGFNWNQLAHFAYFIFAVKTEELIYLSCFSVGILAAILLIHGAFQVRRNFLLTVVSIFSLIFFLFAAQSIYAHLLDLRGIPSDYLADNFAGSGFTFPYF